MNKFNSNGKLKKQHSYYEFDNSDKLPKSKTTFNISYFDLFNSELYMSIRPTNKGKNNIMDYLNYQLKQHKDEDNYSYHNSRYYLYFLRAYKKTLISDEQIKIFNDSTEFKNKIYDYVKNIKHISSTDFTLQHDKTSIGSYMLYVRKMYDTLYIPRDNDKWTTSIDGYINRWKNIKEYFESETHFKHKLLEFI